MSSVVFRVIPLLAAFVGGAATMVVELAVGRILGPRLGSSLHTWSALIGFVLAGLAIGSWLGGRLADRHAPRLVLGGALALGALSGLALLPLAGLPSPGWIGSADVLGQVLWSTAVLVVAPSLALGAVVPAAARLAIADDRGTAGRSLGLVYAAGTLGSIAGTLVTGFVLVDRLGSRPSVAVASAVLAVVALLVLGPARAGPTLVFRMPLMAAFPLFALLFPGALRGPCTLESSYFCIQVQTRPGGEAQTELRALMLDKLLHSYNVPDDPTHLEYGYTRYFAEVLRLRAEQDGDLRTLFVGGGGYTVPRYVEATYPSAAVDVVEIDPKVTLAAQRYLGLRADTRIRTYNEDARQFFLERRTPGGYDVVFGDAFGDLSIPFQLTTREFNEVVKASLAPDGIYVSNVIDLFPAGDFLRAFLATQRAVFPHVGVMLEPQVSASSPWGDGPVATKPDRTTFVVLASSVPLPLEQLRGRRDAPGVVLDVERFEALVGGGGIVLTDNYAPVDGLTSRLFLSRY